MSDTLVDRVRLDKWLWAARFYKTRSAASEAVLGGKVEVNGEPAKPSKLVHAGDFIRVRIAPFEHTLVVTGVAERRGSAAVAATLYSETEESRTGREKLAEQLRLAPQFDASSGKPSRKDRKAWDRFKGR